MAGRGALGFGGGGGRRAAGGGDRLLPLLRLKAARGYLGRACHQVARGMGGAAGRGVEHLGRHRPAEPPIPRRVQRPGRRRRGNIRALAPPPPRGLAGREERRTIHRQGSKRGRLGGPLRGGLADPGRRVRRARRRMRPCTGRCAGRECAVPRAPDTRGGWQGRAAGGRPPEDACRGWQGRWPRAARRRSRWAREGRAPQGCSAGAVRTAYAPLLDGGRLERGRRWAAGAAAARRSAPVRGRVRRVPPNGEPRAGAPERRGRDAAAAARLDGGGAGAGALG